MPPSRRAARRRGARPARRRRARARAPTRSTIRSSSGAATASNAGVVTPSDANAAAHTPRSVAGSHAGPERGDHRREPGSGDDARPARHRRSSPDRRIRHSSANNGPASTISAPGIACATSALAIGVIPSTPTRRASRTPSIAVSGREQLLRVPGDAVEVLDRESRSATTASVFESRCTAPVRRTTTQPGANARVPASQSRARVGDGAGVRLASEQQHVDVVSLHQVDARREPAHGRPPSSSSARAESRT